MATPTEYKNPIVFEEGISTDTISEETAAAGVTIDGLKIKDGGISPTTSTTIGVSGSSAGTLTTTIDAVNAGAGAGNTVVTADNAVSFGDAGNPTVDFAGSGAVTFSGNPTINTGTGALTVGGSTAVNASLTTTRGITAGDSLRVGGRAAQADASTATAVTNTAVETASRTYTIPANTLTAGAALRVRFAVRATATNANDTLTVRLKLGSTSLIATSAVDVANDNVVVGQFVASAAAAPGAAVSVSGCGFFNQPAAAGGAMISAYLTPTNFATNGALALTVTLQWSAADPGNSGVCEIFDVEVV